MTEPSAKELAALAAAVETADRELPEEAREALDPEEPVVSGVRLLPLTMGHLGTLEAIGSPLVTGGKPAPGHDWFSMSSSTTTRGKTPWPPASCCWP